jgi:opacity protein-like surface antigen
MHCNYASVKLSRRLQEVRKLFALSLIVLLFGISAWAQEIRHEFTVQGSGFFSNQTTANGITSKPTYSGGVMAGYRFNLNKWLAVEGDYDYSRPSEKYFISGSTARVPTNVHGMTGVGVVKLPILQRFRPFVLAGGGAMVFDPHNNVGVSRQTKGAFVYGAGGDYPIMRHVALRAQYRGFVYKIPDFNTSTLKIDKFTHTAVPSAGLVLTF